MERAELASRVESLCNRDTAAFDSCVEEEAEWLRSAVAGGEFDSEVTTVGLEYECYLVDGRGELATVSGSLSDLPGCEEEIGRHQVEFQATPQPVSGVGFETIESELRARFEMVSDALLDDDHRLVSDGVWTIAPRDECAASYLTDAPDTEGEPLAKNMVDKVRYHAQGRDTATEIDAPHVTLSGETALLNSLTTSIQPHYVVPRASELPTYFRYALRVAGPLLALGANSPLFPPELYDDDDPEAILADSRMENRIGVFETVMNSEDGQSKVAFPDDIADVTEAIDAIVDDPTVLPVDADSDGDLSHFSRKHGCYWRWIRPVFDEGRSGNANVRIEFRPIPGQPTIRDSVGFVGLLAGLLTELPRREHPVADLDWSVARDNFYAAASDGLAADLRWIDSAGARTERPDEIFADLFRCASDGLEAAGLSPGRADRVLAPLRARVRQAGTPARWKMGRVKEAMAAGDPFERAVHDAQRAYLSHQRETFDRGRFDVWSLVDRDRTGNADPGRGSTCLSVGNGPAV